MANKDMANINNNNNNNHNNIVIMIIIMGQIVVTYLPLLSTYQVNTFFKHFPPKFQNCREGQKDK